MGRDLRIPSAVLYGYRPADRKVIGMWILDSRETPGLGDKIYKDAAVCCRTLMILPLSLPLSCGEEREEGPKPNEVDCHHRRHDLLCGGGKNHQQG